MDPDPGGPKTYWSGSETLAIIVMINHHGISVVDPDMDPFGSGTSLIRAEFDLLKKGNNTNA
jgi:hypothetical protein